MADTPRDPETYTRRRQRPLGLLASLTLVAVALVLIAYLIYDPDAPDSFDSSLAKGVLLNGAVVAILGAVVATVLSRAAETRSWQEADAGKRLGLFRRMRDAHLQVVLIQQILRARRDPETYDKQMRTLQKAVKDMEEIREEVNVSSRLYDDADRRMIMTGIDLLGIYLSRGVSEHLEWWKTVEPPNTPEKRPDGDHSWVVGLVAEHDQPVLRGDNAETDGDPPTPEPGDDDYAPPGGMPPEYEDGLERSKLIMRLYIYEPSRTKRADKRREIVQRIEKREKAEEATVPPSARAGRPTPD
jgi:hypothetical protein